LILGNRASTRYKVNQNKLFDSIVIVPLSESINGQVQCLPAVARIITATWQTSKETMSYLSEYAHVLAA
jgi:hypothetical protein